MTAMEKLAVIEFLLLLIIGMLCYMALAMRNLFWKINKLRKEVFELYTIYKTLEEIKRNDMG